MTVDRRDGAGLHRGARRRRTFLCSAAAGCALAAILTGCSNGGTSAREASSDAARASAGTYGSLPSFLPTSTVVPDSVLTGEAGKPALTTEGDSVDVRLTGGTVRATISGPVVPGEGLPVQTEATTCTWTVTLSRASRPVSINAAEFTTLDHLGAVYRTSTVPGEPAPPARLGPGATATFELRAVMPTGEGLMRWAPDGRHIAASWDFEVEND